MVREVLQQHDVRDQSRAPVDTLEQIVAQERVFGDAPAHALLKGVHIVDTLADENPLAKQVLIDIGDGQRIQVDPGAPRINSRKPRPFGARGVDLGPRLEYGITGRDTVRRRVELGHVQRVGERGDQPSRRVALQHRVGVQRNHIAHLRQQPELADQRRKRRAVTAAVFGQVAPQQPVELVELPALAFPPHPDAFAGVPQTPPVKEIERAARIPSVEFFDGARGAVQQGRVFGHSFGIGIAKVRQQGKADGPVRVRVAQIMHFQLTA